MSEKNKIRVPICDHELGNERIMCAQLIVSAIWHALRALAHDRAHLFSFTQLMDRNPPTGLSGQ